MLRNHFRIALRHLWHSKLYSGINVAGLAAGICCVLLAILFLRDEQSFDDFHANNQNLFRVTTTLRTFQSGDRHTVGGTGQVQAPAFKAAVPEIRDYVRVLGGDIYGDVVANNKVIKLQMLFVDSSFFNIFSFPLLSGNARSALTNIQSAVITESIARKYFNRTDVVGELLQLGDDPSAQRLGKPMIITAVTKDPPQNSSIRFDVLFPLTFMQLSFVDESWTNAYLGTFLLLKPGADLNKVTAQFNGVYARHAAEQVAQSKKAYGIDPAVSYGLQNMRDIHLNPLLKFEGNREAGIVNESRPVFSWLFLGIAAFILLMAAINFINISIAGSLKRAREVGVRKISGGSKLQIILQFIVETSLLCLLSFILAISLASGILPLFNELSGKSIVLAEAINATLVFWFFCLFVAIVLLTSVYPAWVLSGFKPTQVLYQKQRLSGRNWLGRSLVVVQFSLAIFFVIATIIYYRQMNYVRTKDLGYNPDNTIYSWIKGNRKLKDVQPLLKAELAKEPSIRMVAFGGELFYEEAKIADKKLKVFHKIGDENYLEALQIKLKAGRNFSTAHTTDISKSVIVNESFVKAAGIADPIGMQIQLHETYGKEPRTIIGVVGDYHFESLREPIKPMILMMSDWASGAMWIRFEKDKEKQALAAFQKAYEKIMPNALFEYAFTNESAAGDFRQENRWQKIITAATLLCLLICSLGLFGLAHLGAQQRVKEIGIRKVLGASVVGITVLLSKDFLQLVAAALLIASPLAALVMSSWLQDFAYRVQISWWIFAFAAAIAISVALLTVSIQAAKAAMANPVKSLRTD